MADPDYFWNCAKCGVRGAMSKSLNDWFRADARKSFYCVNGHSNHYSNDQNDIDKIRRERDALKQNTAYLEDAISSEREARKAAERQASARKGQVTRLKNRAAAGVCPCCNRTFQNLARHMAGQHPQYTAEEVT